MDLTDDSRLLRQYAENGTDDAFATLVERHINLVYSVALRQVRNPHQAEEITQAVFIILAKKAAVLRHEKAVSSWLFQTTRLTANNFKRSEIRRQCREQEAYMESIFDRSGNDTWEKIGPMLDDAVGALKEKERRAIILRFYERKNLSEVGLAMGTSEEAAKKRVARALEKLQKLFLKRGVALTAPVIAGSISAHSVQAAPPALAMGVKTVAVAKGAVISGSTLTLVKGAMRVMAWTKAQTTIVAGIGVILIGTGAYETSHAARLDQQNQSLQQQQTTLSTQTQQLQSALDEASNRLASLSDDSPERQREKSELLRLRGEAAQMQSLQQEMARLKQAVVAKSNESNGAIEDSNRDIVEFLGTPVPAPTNLNAAFNKDGLIQATQLAAQNAGITLKNIQIDGSEFPFLIGVVCEKGEFDKLTEQMKKLDGYQYGGSMSSDSCGAFSLTPYAAYPPGASDIIPRRLIVRQAMLFNKMNAQAAQTASQ
ncbi:MAG TPA: sigma-70 family RNA polymerase sigma factor [Verrucomicrobiae bacterium]|jgi:RNA polymerase sigma factor (sigma-70 family)|nr:sigma-70 family RNA polymerase sigma factor [Verrucomicrobiae bacterium]